ncbi:MAG: hypothetical protein IPG90_17840 [Bacteroidetes bacterium]|nr:hypothetical protein [Bacteroidota bacterium]
MDPIEKVVCLQLQFEDIEIQKRENDLVLASFGRGFYILDDYTPLRTITKADLTKEAWIAPIKDSWMFNESRSRGAPLKGFPGEGFFLCSKSESRSCVHVLFEG